MTPKFTELGLSEDLLRAIDKLGFEQASPIQAAAIPPLLQGKDIVGQSQTGSGKTAAFGIPAVEKIDVNQRAVQVLILCPTRELAIQVSEEIHKLSFFKRGVMSVPIYGGQSYERQFYGLKQGAQIVIGTPGRIMDHMRRGTLRLDTVKMVILDEADVMLNMGFRDDIETILKDAPTERQTIFFSATMPRPIRDLIEKYAHNPENVKIEQKALTVPTVEQVYYEVDRRFKIELLMRLIDFHDLKLGIIFCNTKRMVDDLVDHLEAAGYMADRLHGDMTQNMRDRVMNKFRKSGLEFLVATDVAARGIDVDDVQVVFNYDLPYDGEDYVHRIGRTGRAGREGRAISFVSGREMFQIGVIERYTKTKIQRGQIPTETEVEDARANVFLDKIRATLQNSDFKRQDRVIERLLEEGFSSTDIASALLHHLQAGEGTSAAKSARTEDYERPERPDRRERRDFREDRRERFEDRRPQRHEPRERFDRPQRPERRPVESGRSRSHETQAEKNFQAPRVVANEPQIKPAPEKTYSDEEILSSVKAPSPAPLKPQGDKLAGAVSKPKPKPSRRTPDGQTRLWMNLGKSADMQPIDVVNAIAGETGLPGKAVGMVDVREKHLFVDVASEHVSGIVAKLNRAQIKGHKVKVKVA
ncbi:MAG TPA: DEAD/DEAH box helicase [Verrucomicrobiae bacterium]|nr:DEAD/DEAH box helicase [Verrucomicrobiae bacterium]